MARRNKYGNIPTTVEGITFDSRLEARRYTELRLLERCGEISDLELQRRYELIPAQYEVIDTGEVYKRGPRKGAPKRRSRCVEEAAVYIADFVYRDNRTGEVVVEDTKGRYTKDYVIKRKLMYCIYNIKIKEVREDNKYKK